MDVLQSIGAGGQFPAAAKVMRVTTSFTSFGTLSYCPLIVRCTEGSPDNLLELARNLTGPHARVILTQASRPAFAPYVHMAFDKPKTSAPYL